MKRALVGLSTLLLLVVFNAALAQSGSNDEAVAQEAIQKIWGQYKATAESGDLDGWLALWTEDGVRMPPDAPMSVGKAAIRASMEVPLTQFDNVIDIHVQETVIAGGWAYSRGTYTLTFTPRGGGEGGGAVDGKFTTILQRQPDGSWKIHRDIFNSNVPPQM